MMQKAKKAAITKALVKHRLVKDQQSTQLEQLKELKEMVGGLNANMKELMQSVHKKKSKPRGRKQGTGEESSQQQPQGSEADKHHDKGLSVWI